MSPMIRKIFISKSTTSFFLLLIALLVTTTITAYITVHLYIRSENMKAIKITEPLLIESENNDKNFYVLPVGTVMYHEKGFSEGYSRYIVYFNHKGNIAHQENYDNSEYDSQVISPSWLSNIDDEALKTLFIRFPLSKEDVRSAVQANQITKDDLIDIIRSMPD